MRHREILWLLGVLAVLGLGGYFFSTPHSDGPLRLELVLAADPELQHSFTLTLESNQHGAGYDTLIRACGTQPPFDSHGGINVERFQQLRNTLESKGLMGIPDGDSQEPEAQVLYTRLTVSENGSKRVSQWRGLPTASHRELAGAFLADPTLGPSIGKGLAAVQRFKAGVRVDLPR